MFIIHYKNNEPKKFKHMFNGTGKFSNKAIVEHIVSLEYPVYTLDEKDKWFDIIQKQYGKFGEVTVEERVGILCPLTLENKIDLLIADKLKKDGALNG